MMSLLRTSNLFLRLIATLVPTAQLVLPGAHNLIPSNELLEELRVISMAHFKNYSRAYDETGLGSRAIGQENAASPLPRQGRIHPTLRHRVGGAVLRSHSARFPAGGSVSEMFRVLLRDTLRS